jgi:hypothetical protein
MWCLQPQLGFKRLKTLSTPFHGSYLRTVVSSVKINDIGHLKQWFTLLGLKTPEVKYLYHCGEQREFSLAGQFGME